MKILITGGLGHIGSYLMENINKIRFVKRVYVIDNLSTNRFCSLFNLPKAKIYFYQKDLTKNNALNNFIKVKKVPIERLHIDLRLSGKFLDIGPFFDDVEKEIKLVNLHSYKFSLDQNAAKQVIADIVYYTYQMEEKTSE